METPPTPSAVYGPLKRDVLPPLSQRTGWIGWALVAGLAVGVPSGWLLAYLAALPFMLGLFFFLLLGLVTGATMFRFGSRAAPPATWVLWFVGSTVAMMLMLASLWAEYRALPRSVKDVVRHSYYKSFPPTEAAALQANVHGHVASYLAERYPPGGFSGYLRWAARDGTLKCPRFQEPDSVDYQLPYKRGPWLFRVGVCVLLIEWTIMSQMLALRTPHKGADVQEAADSDEVHPSEQT